MSAARVYRVIGLMSGTSLDGIDAAFLATDGRGQLEPGAFLTLPYAPEFRQRLRGVLGGQGDVAGVERELTHLHAEAVTALREANALGPIDLVGFHGHTILHRPQERRTWQIGDGALLARLTGIDVINDFRSNDVAAGGEGAPLAPLYHQALAGALARPAAVLNVGGVANVTWIGAGEDDILAFDTGPGNALIDDWMLRHAGAPFDTDGALARQGRVSEPHARELPRASLFRAQAAQVARPRRLRRVGPGPARARGWRGDAHRHDRRRRRRGRAPFPAARRALGRHRRR